MKNVGQMTQLFSILGEVEQQVVHCFRAGVNERESLRTKAPHGCLARREHRIVVRDADEVLENASSSNFKRGPPER